MTSTDDMMLPNKLITEQLIQRSSAHGAVRAGVCLTDRGVVNIRQPTVLRRSVDPNTGDWAVLTRHFMMACGGAKVKLHSFLTLIRY